MSKAARARVREAQPQPVDLEATLGYVGALDALASGALTIDETGTVVAGVGTQGWDMVETSVGEVEVVETTDHNLVDEDGEFLRGLAAINTSPVQLSEEQVQEQAEIDRDISATVAAVHGMVADPTPRMDQARLELRIRLVSASCPKRPGSIAADSWALYVDGMTVSAYLASHDRRRARRDLQWDLEHGFVRLETQAEWVASQQEAEA